jgi:hypothetical protein
MNAPYVHQERHEFDATRSIAEVEGARRREWVDVSSVDRAEVDGERARVEIDGRQRAGVELPAWDRTHGRAEM